MPKRPDDKVEIGKITTKKDADQFLDRFSKLQEDVYREGEIVAAKRGNDYVGGVILKPPKAVHEYTLKRYARHGVEPDVSVSNFIVSPSERGKGIGGKLLSEAVKGRGTVILGTDNRGEHTDQAALHLYEKAGFRPVRRERRSTFWVKEAAESASRCGAVAATMNRTEPTEVMKRRKRYEEEKKKLKKEAERKSVMEYVADEKPTVDDLPKYLYHGSPGDFDNLKNTGEGVHLTVAPGLASAFVIKRDEILKGRKGKIRNAQLIWNKPMKELAKPIKKHEVSVLSSPRAKNPIVPGEKGKSKGFVYQIETDKIKDKLHINPPEPREIIFTGESAPIKKKIPVEISWETKENKAIRGGPGTNTFARSLLEKEAQHRKRVEVYGIKDGKLLSGRFPDESVGVYGGGIDEGELAEDAARREFMEEAGYKLRNLRASEVAPFESPWVEWEGGGLEKLPPEQREKVERRIKKYPSGHQTLYYTGEAYGTPKPIDTSGAVRDVQPRDIAEEIAHQKAMIPKMKNPHDIRRLQSRLEVLESLTKKASKLSGEKRTKRTCMKDGCDAPATRGVVWADGRGVVLCCEKHMPYFQRKQSDVVGLRKYDPDAPKGKQLTSLSKTGGLEKESTSKLRSMVRAMELSPADLERVRHLLPTGSQLAKGMRKGSSNIAKKHGIKIKRVDFPYEDVQTFRYGTDIPGKFEEEVVKDIKPGPFADIYRKTAYTSKGSSLDSEWSTRHEVDEIREAINYYKKTGKAPPEFPHAYQKDMEEAIEKAKKEEERAKNLMASIGLPYRPPPFANRVHMFLEEEGKLVGEHTSPNVLIREAYDAGLAPEWHQANVRRMRKPTERALGSIGYKSVGSIPKKTQREIMKKWEKGIPLVGKEDVAALEKERLHNLKVLQAVYGNEEFAKKYPKEAAMLEKTAATRQVKMMRQLAKQKRWDELNQLVGELMGKGVLKTSPQGTDVARLGTGAEAVADLVVGAGGTRVAKEAPVTVRKVYDPLGPIYSKEQLAEKVNAMRRLRAKADRGDEEAASFARLYGGIRKAPAGGRYTLQEFVPNPQPGFGGDIFEEILRGGGVARDVKRERIAENIAEQKGVPWRKAWEEASEAVRPEGNPLLKDLHSENVVIDPRTGRMRVLDFSAIPSYRVGDDIKERDRLVRELYLPFDRMQAQKKGLLLPQASPELVEAAQKRMTAQLWRSQLGGGTPPSAIGPGGRGITSGPKGGETGRILSGLGGGGKVRKSQRSKPLPVEEASSLPPLPGGMERPAPLVGPSTEIQKRVVTPPPIEPTSPRARIDVEGPQFTAAPPTPKEVSLRERAGKYLLPAAAVGIPLGLGVGSVGIASHLYSKKQEKKKRKQQVEMKKAASYVPRIEGEEKGLLNLTKTEMVEFVKGAEKGDA